MSFSVANWDARSYALGALRRFICSILILLVILIVAYSEVCNPLSICWALRCSGVVSIYVAYVAPTIGRAALCDVSLSSAFEAARLGWSGCGTVPGRVVKA